MPNPAALRERRLRMTKAQLIDEIDTLEQRAAALEAANRSSAPMPAKASEGYLANQQLADLARFPSENPNPVLRVMPDGTVLYANDAAIAVNGLLKERKKSTLAGDLAGVCAEASGTAEVRETEFESGDRVFAFSIAPVAGETYINIYGRDITNEFLVKQEVEVAKKESAAAQTRLLDAVESLPAAFVLYDPDDRLLMCNKTFRDIYGYSEEEAVAGVSHHELFEIDIERGNVVADIDEPDLFEHYLKQRAALRRKREGMAEVQLANGRWLQRHERTTSTGDQVSIQLDITARKRAEAELAEKEAQLRVALDHMPPGMWSSAVFVPRKLRQGCHLA